MKITIESVIVYSQADSDGVYTEAVDFTLSNQPAIGDVEIKEDGTLKTFFMIIIPNFGGTVGRRLSAEIRCELRKMKCFGNEDNCQKFEKNKGEYKIEMLKPGFYAVTIHENGAVFKLAGWVNR